MTSVPRRLLVFAVVTFAVLTACGSDTKSSPSNTSTGGGGGTRFTVTLSDKGCEPAAFDAPAGRVSFAIKNTSKATVEFEVLQGTKVLGERENLAPGLSADLDVTVGAGAYDLICGDDDKPKGKLTAK